MTTATLTSRSPSTADGRAAAATGDLRRATTLILTGVVAEFVVTLFHPSHAAPNDHHAAFAEYAHSHGWIAVHLGQFAAGLVILTGFLALLRALEPTSRSPLTVRAGQASVAVAAAITAALQAVDGFALKHAVDSISAVPAALQAAAFHDAETVRWVEWSMAGYYRITTGLTLALVGAAILAARALPRWTGALAVLSGAAFVVDGIGVGTDGFAGTTVANLVSLLGLVVFAVVTTVAAWRRRPATR
jgi:hypothetical protein